jgi:uncharacterized membrane protein YebE (DUF533 family)
MFDAKALLEQFLGPQAAATAQGYIDQGTKALENAVGADTLAKGKQMLGDGLTSLEATASQVVGADKVAAAKDFVSNNQNGLAVGAVAGSLLGLLVGTETGRKVGGEAAKLGALAALGGLAWKAYQSYQAGEATSAAAPVPPAPPAKDEAGEQKLAEASLVAMIQAAKADGAIDETERKAIVDRVGNAGPEAQAFLEKELAAPIDIDRLAGMATSTEDKIHVYAASLLAIDVDQTAEKAYLAALAAKLGLDQTLVDEITRQVKGA